MSSANEKPNGTFIIEVTREEDGRWIADIEAIHGALAYGSSREGAIAKGGLLGTSSLTVTAGWQSDLGVDGTMGSSC